MISTEEISPNLDLIPVILSGGSGSRLWPLSRESYPKQYLNLNGKNQFSLLQNTFLRLKGINNLNNPIIISNNEQRFIVAEQMREIDVKPNTILLEPIGKNTAPAVTLAALKAIEKGQDPLLLVLSSDHKIDEDQKFREVIKSGCIEAQNGRLVTFGIVPDSPETGFGYIESDEELSKVRKFSTIKNFFEKPNKELAEKFLEDKHYLWNSGIFLFRASIFLKELEKFEPDILKICNESFKKAYLDLDFLRIDEEFFNKCPNKPLDIAVMERTRLGSVFSLDVGWDDIGSWSSVWKNSIKDKNGNCTSGKILMEESKNCYVRSEERLIVGIALNNIIIVDTKDALLVSNKDTTQKVKQIVQKLNKNNFKEGKVNKRDFRPWGSFTNIEEGSTWKVKRLEIKPNSSISLQLHNKRSEHWIVVAGKAKIELDGEISFLEKNESIYIPLGSKHRLSNPENELLILIEVQSGSYLGEDDIVRFEDIYGRS